LLVALFGFWEWRSALLMGLAIPITLTMTFAFMNAFGIDLQQISIASLILALGLLVDDPVVAADAIKRSLAEGWKPLVAAWLGPTKLASAIMFATITNIAAYLPLLTVPGDTGKFIYSLPVVLTLSLVASRIVSMTFIPLLGSFLLRPPKRPELPPEERRSRGFARYYARTESWLPSAQPRSWCWDSASRDRCARHSSQRTSSTFRMSTFGCLRTRRSFPRARRRAKSPRSSKRRATISAESTRGRAISRGRSCSR